MSENDPRPSNRNWRGGGRGARAGGEAGERTPGFMKVRDRSHEDARLWHWVKVAVWSLLFLGLLAWLLWFLYPRPRRPALLVAAATAYDAPLPLNAWAREDVARLRALDRQGEEVVKYVDAGWDTWLSGEDRIRLLRQKLDEQKPGGPGKDVVMFYVNMHGLVDGEGEPCLVPPGASPYKSEEWLRVRELLDRLFLADGNQRLPKVKKLLIFDCGRIDVNWNMGVLCNEFPDRLRDVVKDLKIDDLYVLTSAATGQASWTAPELGGSAFAYFLFHGLRGEADEVRGGDPDGKVSLSELYAYLTAQVGGWVRDHRDDDQQPLLFDRQGDVVFPGHRDFSLVHALPESEAKVTEPAAEDETRWEQTAELWRRHQGLQERMVYRWCPLAWEEFQQGLLRLEQSLAAGEAGNDKFDDARRQLTAAADALSRPPATASAPAYSLALAHRLHGKPSDKDCERLRAEMAKLPEDGAADQPIEKPAGKTAEKPAEKPGEKPAEKPPGDGGAKTGVSKDKTEEKPPEKPPPAPPAKSPARWDYLAAAAVAWQDCLAGKRDPSAALRLMAAAQKPQGADAIEIHFLRMLDRYLDDRVGGTDTGRACLRNALKMRDQAEQAASPADLRAHYATESLVAEADQARREAEDKLFVGGDDALRELKASGSAGWKPGTVYGEAVDRAKKIDLAFQTRDRAFAELPYLAQWLLGRLQRDGKHDGELRNLIERTQSLGARLDRALSERRDPKSDRPWPANLAEDAAKLKQSHGALRQVFYDECKELGAPGGDKQTLRRIAAVLAVPLVTGDVRNRLRDRYSSIIRETAGEHYTVREDASRLAIPYAERLAQWEEHPASMLLRPEEIETGPDSGKGSRTTTPAEGAAERSTAANAAKLFVQGEQVRRRLAAVFGDVQQPGEAPRRLRETGEALDKWPPHPGAVARSSCATADRLVRRTAALWAGRARSEAARDPADLLYRIDLRYFLLWQAGRALDDFWGPAPGERKPYFETVAEGYLQSADSVCKGRTQFAELKARRALAARAAMQPSNPANVYVDTADSGGTRPAQVLLVPQTFQVEIAKDLPKGEAAFYVEDTGGGLLELTDGPQKPAVRRKGVRVEGLPSPSQFQGKYSLKLADRKEGKSLQALALYRGHLRTATFQVLPAGGVNVVCRRPREEAKTTITVSGDVTQKASIIFILDCSRSMEIRDVPPEGGVGPRLQRMAVARDKLRTILDTLTASADRYRVGVMVYGDTYRFDDDDPEPDPEKRKIVKRDLKTRQLAERAAGDTGHPNTDVRELLALGTLSEDRFVRLKEDLAELVPTGQTPLYYSMILAMRKLPQDGPKHVVVITDGFDEQWGSTGKTVRAAVETELARHKGEDLHLDIVGLQIVPAAMTDGRSIAAAQKQLEDSKAELRALTRLGNGHYYDAKDPSDLLRALRESLRLSQYVVTGLDGQARSYGPLDLNRSCALESPVPGASIKYQISLAGQSRVPPAEVEIEGGEDLELFLHEGPQAGMGRLVHHPYPKNDDGIRAKKPALRHPVLFKAFMGALDRGGVDFRVSVQTSAQDDKTAEFSRRPKEVWLEVRPVVNEKTQKPLYCFYDMNFEPHRPAPVLTYRALGWPESAKNAEILVWCRFEKTQPDRVLTVAEFAEAKQSLPAVLPAGRSDKGEVTFELKREFGKEASDPCRVIVTESHPHGSDLHAFKVEMLGPPGSPHAACDEIRHRYVAIPGQGGGTVRHEFVFDHGPPSQGLDNFRVCLTSRERLRRGAVESGPMQVTIEKP